MNLSELGKLISDPRERVIMVEEGKPTYVVMGLEAYHSLKGSWSGPVAPSLAPRVASKEEPPMERINAELEAERLRAKELAARLSMTARSEPKGPPAEPDYSQIRLEDLPL